MENIPFVIWIENIVIPAVLSQAETWIGIKQKTIKDLEKMQLKFLRLILGVGTGCPIPMMYAHTGTQLMANRVLLRKILMLWHVANLPTNTLANQTYRREVEQYESDPTIISLVSECRPYLSQFGVTDLQAYTKQQFKRIMKHKIFMKNKNDVCSMAVGYKKIDYEAFLKEPFVPKDYFKSLSVAFSRLQFKIFARVTPKIASNFHRDPRYKSINYRCVGCSVGVTGGAGGVTDGGGGNVSGSGVDLNDSLDSESHVLRCFAYAKERQNLDLTVQADMLQYFQRVIDRRIEEEKNNII